MNILRITTRWLESKELYQDEIISTFDLKYLFKVWKIIKTTDEDTFNEDRKVLSVEFV
jgi:hypothetical protein